MTSAQNIPVTASRSSVPAPPGDLSVTNLSAAILSLYVGFTEVDSTVEVVCFCSPSTMLLRTTGGQDKRGCSIT